MPRFDNQPGTWPLPRWKVGNILEAPEPERPARIEQYVRSVWAAWANEHRRLIEKWYNQEVVPDL